MRQIRFSWQYVLRLGLVVVTYFIAAKIGLAISAVHGSVSLLWPATGVALAIIVLFGWQYWPGLLIGAFLANALTNGPLTFALMAAIGNTLEALLGAYLLRRYTDFHPALDRVQDVVALVCFAAALSTVVSATFGAIGLCLNGMAPWDKFASTWAVWWFGDATGDLVVAPVVLSWGSRRLIKWHSRQAIEICLSLLAIALASWLAFNAPISDTSNDFSLAYLSFPFLMWAALRFGMCGGSAATLLVSSIAVWGTLNRQGLFASHSVNAPLLFLAVFIGVASVTTMFLAAAVTERQKTEGALRQSEAQYRELNTELEQRVRQRTVQLEEAIQARDDFLSTAAHELKTPITSLHGFSQLLQRRMNKTQPLPPAEVDHAISVIDKQAMKLTRLVSQLLDVSRLEVGRLVLDRQQTDISKVLQEVVSIIQTTTSRHEIVFHSPPTLIAQVDALRLEQVVINLLDNAIKYSPDGGTITLDLTAPSPDHLRLSCTDSGIGIPLEHREHIFDRFYRAHIGQHISGMGLGLYISWEIIKLHGGSLTVEFPEAGGTRFVISLPC